MFKTYLKIAWRNLWKSRVMTGVNLLGMTAAFTVALLLAMTVYSEFSYDNFHTNSPSIFQVYRSVSDRDRIKEMANLPMPANAALKNEAPGVKAATRVIGSNASMRVGDKEVEQFVTYVDADFLRMFTFPVVSGSKAPLQGMSDMVLTEKLAHSLFGNADPVGKTVQVKTSGDWKPFQVSAVVKDVPQNSTIDFACLQRYENYASYEQCKNRWDNSMTDQYIQLENPAAAGTFTQQIQGMVNKYYAGTIEDHRRDGAQPDANGNFIRLQLLPLKEVHFNPITGGSGRQFIYLLMAIACFIIFIAATNFVNIALARAFGRGREIGMRKVMGALERQLVLQLWSETLIQCLIALVLGLLCARLLLPFYNSMFRAELSFSLLKDPYLLAYTATAFVLITVFAGGYPAWRMARFNTLQVLKGKLRVGSNNRLRNSLIVGQFTIAAALICCTLVAWQQLNYLRNMPLGYNKEEVISIPLDNKVQYEQAIQRLRNKLGGDDRIKGISAANVNMGRGNDGSMSTSMLSFMYKDHMITTHWRTVDYDYVNTMGMRLLAGRDFAAGFATDTNALVINEAMARLLGGAEKAVGQLMPVSDNQPPMPIIGVVKDFNFESLKKTISPLSFTLSGRENLRYIFVKVGPGNLPASMRLVKQAWEEVAPGSTFQGSFLDENTDRQYNQEGRLSRIFISAAVLAILIACMGLFAIAVMAMAQRTREIGIRKVLGASVNNLVVLLSADFLKLVALSILLAAPLAWFGMDRWLSDYAYRIHIQGWTFLLVAVIAVGIAFCTVSFNAIRTALANPVKSLRSLD